MATSSPPRHIEVIARALMFRAEHVLVCWALDTRRGTTRATGALPRKYCYLPGGHVEFGESATTAVARELWEEARTRIRVGELIHVSEQVFGAGPKRHHEVNLMFRAEHPSRGMGLPAVISSEGWIEFEWLDRAGLKRADLRPAATKRWVIQNWSDLVESRPPTRGLTGWTPMA